MDLATTAKTRAELDRLVADLPTYASAASSTVAGRGPARPSWHISPIGERVSACNPSQLAELLTHVAAAIDRYGAGEIDAYAVDETIHHYHRAAGELWKFCFARGGGRMPSSSPASSTA